MVSLLCCGFTKMHLICLLLLLPLGGILVLTSALDELEIDAQVAPPPVAASPTFKLWRSFVGQVREVLHRWQPTVRTTTRHPLVLLRTTTTEPELQFYGALNPIFQMRGF